MGTRVTTKVTKTLPCVYLCCQCQKINIGKVSFSSEASSRTALTRTSSNRLAEKRRNAAQTAISAKQDKIIPAFNRGSYGRTTRKAVCASCGHKQPWESPAPVLSLAIAAVAAVAVVLCIILAYPMITKDLNLGMVLYLFFSVIITTGFLDMLIEPIIFAITNKIARSKLASAPSPYCTPLLFDPAEPVASGNMNDDPRLAIMQQAHAAQNK